MLTRAEMETRRFDASLLFEAGMSPAAVARKFGVSRVSAGRWKDLWTGGKELRSRKATGRPSRLSGEQLRALYSLWETREKWTCVEFAAAIRMATGVQFHPDHVGRLIRRMGLRQELAGGSTCPATEAMYG